MASQLAAMIKLAQTQEMQFVAVKGGGAAKLLMAKSKVPPKDVAEAMEHTNGKIIARGRCVAEDGTLMFECDKPPPGTLAAVLRNAIKEEAKLSPKLETRLIPTEDGFADRLKAILPTLQKAMADPKVGKDIKLKVSEAEVFGRKKDFARANALLDDAEKLVPPPGDDSFTARVEALVKRVKDDLAKATDPAAKTKLTQAKNLLDDALDEARRKNLDKAKALFGRAEELVVVEYEPEPVVLDRRAELVEKIKELLREVNASKTAAGDVKTKAGGLFKMLGTKDWDLVQRNIDAIEKQLKEGEALSKEGGKRGDKLRAQAEKTRRAQEAKDGEAKSKLEARLKEVLKNMVALRGKVPPATFKDWQTLQKNVARYLAAGGWEPGERDLDNLEDQVGVAQLQSAKPDDAKKQLKAELDKFKERIAKIKNRTDAAALTKLDGLVQAVTTAGEAGNWPEATKQRWKLQRFLAAAEKTKRGLPVLDDIEDGAGPRAESQRAAQAKQAGASQRGPLTAEIKKLARRVNKLGAYADAPLRERVATLYADLRMDEWDKVTQGVTELTNLVTAAEQDQEEIQNGIAIAKLFDQDRDKAEAAKAKKEEKDAKKRTEFSAKLSELARKAAGLGTSPDAVLIKNRIAGLGSILTTRRWGRLQQLIDDVTPDLERVARTEA